jgi:hypothetical protein
MTTGECRWVGREEVHVYAFGSQVRAFRVVTVERDYERQAWMGLDEAAALVVALNEQADSQRALAGECGGFQLEDDSMAKAKKVETKKQTKAPKVKATAKAPDSPPAAKARVAAKLTKAAVKAGAVREKRPSIVAVDTAKREKLTPKSDRYQIEAVVDAKGRDYWIVKLDGFFVAEFDGIAAAKKAYPNASILGGQGCAEAVKGLPEAKAETPAPAPAIPTKVVTKQTGETPEERLARMKAAARKAWETRRAQGWKHPKAKSEMIKKIDAQLAESRAISKQARETFKAIDAKKAERKKAEAVIKRVEKREQAKRLGKPIGGGIAQLKKIMGEAIGLN